MSKNNNLTDFLTDTANAIRTKKGTTAKINPQDFSSEIASIQTGVDTSDATATADDILLGKTAYAKGEKLTGTIETYAGEGGETVNKLASLADGTLTEISADDLAGATKITNYAFYSCGSLITVNIPDSVISIEDSAFQNCVSLTSITIPDSVTSMGNNTFWYCTSLTNIIIPNAVTSIGDYMFSNCTLLASIIIPNSVTSIGNKAFNQCTSLTNIIIPNAVTSIGSQALQIGTSTNKATITMLPTTPPTIQSNTFAASKLNKIIVPAGTGATYKAATNWSNFADYIEEATA